MSYTWTDDYGFETKRYKEEHGMEVQEKEKITEAMKLCESKIQGFFSYLDDTLNKKEASKFKDFILANTFFAGGVFRSILSSTPVNDIDIFFKSYDNVIEFKHLVMSQSVKLFKEITPNGSYNYKGPKGPKISFTTKNYGLPDTVLQRFDITFNMHYYDMLRMEMKFDRDTFQKAGYLNYKALDKSGSIARALRFMNQGWKIDNGSIIDVLKLFWDSEYPFTLGSSGQASTAKLDLLKKAYTEKDYFGRAATDKNPDKLTQYKKAYGQELNVNIAIESGITRTPVEDRALPFDEPEAEETMEWISEIEEESPI